MAYQDDYVMRTITDLVRAIAGLALGKMKLIMTFLSQRRLTRLWTGLTAV